jgi:hypothetical protein
MKDGFESTAFPARTYSLRDYKGVFILLYDTISVVESYDQKYWSKLNY